MTEAGSSGERAEERAKHAFAALMRHGPAVDRDAIAYYDAMQALTASLLDELAAELEESARDGRDDFSNGLHEAAQRIRKANPSHKGER